MSDPSKVTAYGRIHPPREAWLQQAEPEEIVDPALPIVDAHHHLWDLPHTTGHRYLLQDFLADATSGHNIVDTVYMNCEAMYRRNGPEELRSLGETQFAAGQAAMSESGLYGPTRVAAGIVAFADLSLGNRIAPILEQHVQVAGGRLRGIRHAAGWDADPVIGNSFRETTEHLYLSDDFREGVRCLGRMDLTFDAWAYHPQLREVVDLARAFPDMTIIMGHCGCPLGYGVYANKRNEVFQTWKDSLAALAACPNVVLKLGGLTVRLAAFDYNTLPRPPKSVELAEIWRPYIKTCIDLFGAKRCFFESNFPVEKQGVGYAALWNTFKRIVSDASDDEKLDLFSRNARRVYRL